MYFRRYLEFKLNKNKKTETIITCALKNILITRNKIKCTLKTEYEYKSEHLMLNT